MTSLETCIKDAVDKGGYSEYALPKKTGTYGLTVQNVKHNMAVKNIALLDPLFWQALGRAKGWSESKFYSYDGVHKTIGENMSEAQWYSRCFWNHIWEGKDAESYFAAL